jgi:hypothetical protein
VSRRHQFTPVGADEIRWHDELPWHPAVADLFWLDGDLDSGHHIGIGLLRSRPLAGGMPSVTVTVMTPTGEVIELDETFTRDGLVPREFGATWGEAADLEIEVDDQGTPRGFRLRVSLATVELDVECESVCVGAKFVDRSPGYTSYDEASGSAAGWWPLVPRATSTGTLRLDEATFDATGAFHIERQLSSFPLGGSAGEKSAQSIWSWGHLYADDYTAVWTDSGASEHFGYHHFTPFMLWRDREPLLQTFAFASYVERFVRNPQTGLVQPSVTTLKASDGTTDLFVRLTEPRNFTHVELNGKPGSLYCRQRSRVSARVDTPSGTERFSGRAVHEWGSQAGNYPFTTEPPAE